MDAPISEPLKGLSKPLVKVLMFFARQDLKAEQGMDFPSFATGYREWVGKPRGEKFLVFCLNQLNRRNLLALSGTLAGNDLRFTMTAQGVQIGQEAYLLAEGGVDDFDRLLPERGQP